MLGSNTLDVLIGLVVVFLLMSFICTAIRETLAGMFKTRARFLARGIEELFSRNARLIQAFYDHPQIYGLFQGRYPSGTSTFAKWRAVQTLPSYIPARNFSSALVDLAARGLDVHSTTQSSAEASPLNTETIRRFVGELGEPRVQRVLLSAVDSANGDLEKVHLAIEGWFNGSMDRVSGWYKRRTQWVLFCIGVVATVLLNVDTIEVATTLYRDPARRQAAVAMAGRMQTAGMDTAAKAAIASLDTLGIPMGWSGIVNGNWPAGAEWEKVQQEARSSVVGWLITAFAISLGAPFWFDLLNKLMVIRATVKPREKSQEEGSEDRASSPDRRGGTLPSRDSGSAGVSVPAGAPGVPRIAAPSPQFTLPMAAGFKPHEWSEGDPNRGIL